MKVGDTVLMTACGLVNQPVTIICDMGGSAFRYFVQTIPEQYYYSVHESELALPSREVVNAND
jgi:hypothetical protein